jgi:putative ATP-dependent endonuclease of OLD family
VISNQIFLGERLLKINQLKITNFRGLRSVVVPWSSFVCLIGENNAGKSSILQALLFFLNGSPLPKSMYFDEVAEVRIEVEFTDIQQGDLNRLSEAHREEFASSVSANGITLVRIWGADGRSRMRYRARVPRDHRFSQESVDALLSGKKPSQALMNAVIGVFPELTTQITLTTNQTQARALIAALGSGLPEDQTEPSDSALRTGIDRSIDTLLPEPIYIPAVKDLRDDIKTTDSSPFGKIIGMLLRSIEPELGSIQQHFAELNKKLNRVLMADGQVQDDRLDAVRAIESRVEGFVKESFASVGIRLSVPPPELKAVLSGAQVLANDGVEGTVESKGDGLRRAVVFAILRAFVALRSEPQANEVDRVELSYLILFEEPELYLHPKGQQILFDTLSSLSRTHHVAVTTHSPTFFGPNATTTFIKLKKTSQAGVHKPFTVALPVDLGDTTAKDQFQIICYENNSIAFFAERVVLVEGDSDLIVLPHLARQLNPSWDTRKSSVCFAKINGKGSIRRYREFFSRFGIRVFVVADLDLIVRGFEKVNPDSTLQRKQSHLLQLVDTELEADGPVPAAKGSTVRDAQQSGDVRALWKHAREVQQRYAEGAATLEDVNAAVAAFFAWERSPARLELLKMTVNQRILDAKNELIEDLASMDVFVLSRGVIEDYYPPETTGADKPSKAQAVCEALNNQARARHFCRCGSAAGGPSTKTEFDNMFERIFQA